jgi:cytochrome b subunit of formate dehydrogenase
VIGSDLNSNSVVKYQKGQNLIKLALLLILTVVPGVAGVAIFGYCTLQDWGALQLDYKEFQRVVQSSADLSTLFKTEAAQNIHRVNLFTVRVWALLTAILGAIGIHGMYLGTKDSSWYYLTNLCTKAAGLKLLKR